MAVSAVKAANDTWAGKAGANWSSSGNWLAGVAPVASDSLFFDGPVGLGLNPNNDFAANTVFNNITFDVGASPFVLGGNVLNLAGNITNNNSLNAQTIGLPLALTGSRVVNVVPYPGSLGLTNAISETGGTGFGLTKTGSGLLTLSASNSFTGPVVISSGTLAVSADVGLGAVPGSVKPGGIALNGGALRVTSAGIINSNRSITLGSGGGTIDVSATVTNNAAISGAGNSLTKTGAGQLTLGGTNSYTGSTIVNDGTLKLDFTQSGAPATNIINSASPLVMGAVSTMYGTVNTAGLPTFNVTGNGSVAVTQAVSGVTFNKGSEIVSTTQTGGKNVLLAVGGITRNSGGMVNIITNGGTFVSGVNAITTAAANGASGILGGWAAFSSTDYAANDGAGNIIAYPSASYTSVALNAAIVSSATSNVRLNSGTGPATLAATGLTTINTLLQNFTTAETLNIGAAQTLAFGANGGVMIGTGKAAVTLGDTVGNGIITAGNGDGVTPGEINVLNFTTSAVNFNSVIADNGSGAVKLSIGALGATGANNTASLNAPNTYSGGTIISSGRIQVVNLNGFGSGPVTVLNNGQAWLAPAAGGTYANNFNISGASTTYSDTPSAIRLGTANTVLTGTITLLTDAAVSPRNATGMQLQGQITGNYNFTIGDGTAGGQVMLFNPANNWGGNLLIVSEKVDVGTAEVIPSGAGYGDVILNNNASAILDLYGNSETINGLSSQGSAPFVQDGGTLILGDGNATATFSGTIRDGGDVGGALNIVKIGSGVQTFSGANTYSGTTTVSNGTLVVSTAQSAAGGAVTVNDGATLGVTLAGVSQLSPSALTVGSSTGATLRLDVNNPDVAPVNPGSFTISGTATININSCPGFTNAYALINNYVGGTVVIGSQPPHLHGFVSASGGVLYYNLTNVDIDIWTAGNGNWDASTPNWTNGLPGNLFSQTDFVRFDDTPAGAGPFVVSNAIIVQPSGIYATNSKNYAITGLAIAGSAGLTKAGSGSLTFSNVNTFTGPTTISAGQLAIGGAGQLGGGAYSAAIVDNGALSYNSSALQTLSGAISGTGAMTNTSGTGTLTLSSGASTFSGGVTVNSGSLNVAASSTPSTAGSTVTSGPVGTGTITLNGGTLNAGVSGGTIANNINVTASSIIQTFNSFNWNINGNILGSGSILYNAPNNAATLSLGGDDSGFTGTFSNLVANAAISFNSASAGSANAAWVMSNPTATRTRFGLPASGTISFGSLSGSANNWQNNTANSTVTMSVGALNTSTTFGGTLNANGTSLIALTKIGTGALTLTGLSSYGGLTTIENGSLVASNNALASATGPFGNASSPIALGDANSLSSSFNASLLIGGGFTVGRAITVGAFTGGNSSVYTIGGSTDTNSTFSGNIALNQSLSVTQVASATTNALTISGVISSADNGETVTFAGPGKIKLSVGNTYTGNTVINAGTLALTASGNIGASAHINVAGGATFDVSGVAYTLGSSQTLSGSGTVTGAVATASIGSSIVPGTIGVVGTLAFANNLNLSSGATVYFDLSTSHSSGNDQIAVGGNLTLGSSSTLHINSLNGSANLDQTADYVLFNVAGTASMSAQPSVVFDGTAPANASHYSVQKSGNNIVLHYSASAAPVVTSVIVTNTLDGSTTAARWQTVTVYATVSAGAGTITNVSANLSSIGGAASQIMNNLGGGNYSYTATVGAGALVGSDSITVAARDTQPLSGANSANLTVTAATVTWDGLAVDNTWGNGTNWVGNNPPGFNGDSVIFTGSTQTTANMNNNYTVTGLTFDSAASSFTITDSSGTALILNGTLENDSSSPQILTMPVSLGAPEIVNDAGGAGIALAGAISGSGALTIGSGVVTLSGSNSYAGDTTVNGTLKVGNSAALPNGGGKGNIILAGTLDLNGTNATINNLLGGAGTVDNTSATNASTLTLGNNNDTISLSGVLVQNSGGTNLALIKVGTGDLALPSANTFGGGLTVSNGSVTLGNNAGAGMGVITLAGGTLFNNATITIANNIFAQAGTTSVIDNASANNFSLNGGFTGSGTITRGSSAVQSLYLNGDNSGFTGTYQDQNNVNSITRFTTNTAGSASARWIFNQAQNLTRTAIQFNSGTISFGSISGAGYLSENGAFVNTVEVGALGLNDTFSGSFQDNGGTLSLNKVGTGTLTLLGPNAYSGLTTVSNGTLVISTAQAGNSSFVVSDGKTLGVTNNITTNTASVNNLTLGTTGGPTTLFFNSVASATIPVITAAGAVTLTGTCNIAISNSVVNSGGVYPLIKYGSLAGAGSFIISSLPSGVSATLTNDASYLWIALKVTVGNGVNTNAASLNFAAKVTGGVGSQTLNLNWAPDHRGWQLYTNDVGLATIGGWFPVPGSASVTNETITIDPSKTNIFFQMRYP